MNIIVAGGSGLIGRALIQALSQDGHVVWVLTRRPGEFRLSQGVQAAGWDGKTPQGWQHLVEQADAIINLSGANIGERPWTNERKQVLRASRVDSGAAITAAVEQSAKRPAVVLQIAGVGYYGPHGDDILDEQAAAGNDFLASVAQDWENSTKGVSSLGVRHVIMRTGVVLTPKGGVINPFLLQHRLFAGGPLGSGKQWMSWVHIQDLVNSFRFFLDCADASGVFNITAPKPVTNATFGRTLGKVMRRPYWLPVPSFALKILLGEMSTIILTGQRVVPQRLLEMGFQFQFPGLRQALEDLLRTKVS